MESRIEHLLNLTHLLDYTMPGIKACVGGWNESSGKDKLCDFAEEYWHYDNITKHGETKFIEHYKRWANKKGYHQSESKASQIYQLAKDGIPAIPSNVQSTKMLVFKALREVNSALFAILTRMQELARTLPEYPIVRAMGGVGDVLSVKLIAEIGDVKRFHSSKGLIAYAGIDPPPYESGKLIGTNST